MEWISRQNDPPFISVPSAPIRVKYLKANFREQCKLTTRIFGPEIKEKRDAKQDSGNDDAGAGDSAAAG
jgi:hypothetical protein